MTKEKYAQWLKLLITAILCWYPFMCLHELGHILSAQFTGGRIQEIILVPWKFSQTVIRHSHHPLIDAWAGPLLGVTLPLFAYSLHKKFKRENDFLSILTGFCLMANGLYIGLGWIDKVGHAGDIITHNFSIISMILFGIISSTTGLFIWHQPLEQAKETESD